MKYILILLVLVFCLWSNLAISQNLPFDTSSLIWDEGQTITITSDEMEFASGSKQLVFKGHVLIRQDKFKLKANLVKILTNDQGKVLSMIAKGNVLLTHNDWKVKCGKLSYNKTTKILLMTNTPQITHKTNTIKGKIIKFLLAENKMIVENAETSISLSDKAKTKPASIK